jgi:hypothetical protein
MNSLMLVMVLLMSLTITLAFFCPLEYKYAAVIPLIAMAFLARLFIWGRRT